jgi:hypothetical protein
MLTEARRVLGVEIIERLNLVKDPDSQQHRPFWPPVLRMLMVVFGATISLVALEADPRLISAVAALVTASAGVLYVTKGAWPQSPD